MGSAGVRRYYGMTGRKAARRSGSKRKVRNTVFSSTVRAKRGSLLHRSRKVRSVARRRRLAHHRARFTAKNSSIHARRNQGIRRRTQHQAASQRRKALTFGANPNIPRRKPGVQRRSASGGPRLIKPSLRRRRI